MRVRARHLRWMTVSVGLAVGLLWAALATSSSPASAVAPPQPTTCGYSFAGLTPPQGAAGTQELGVALRPAVSYQQCTATASISATITTASGTDPGGIQPNAGNYAGPVSFFTGRIAPTVMFGWTSYCTTVAEPVFLVVTNSAQRATYPLGVSTSCASKGFQSSNLSNAFVLDQPSGAVGLAPTAGGYRMAEDGGSVTNFGSAPSLFVPGPSSTFPVVGIVDAPPGDGYWLVASDGGVFSYGSAAFHGSAGGIHLNSPVVGMAADPATGGYWLVAADGGVFSYGAPFYGSAGNIHLNSPVVGMAAAPGGTGYWLVAADGGVFSYGRAVFHGSAGSVLLNAPVVGMAADPATGGYWLTATDGGVFAYDAPFHGSASGLSLNAPVSAMTATGDGGGYWLLGADGGVFAYGDAPFYGRQ
jgi:hypothetical protein